MVFTIYNNFDGKSYISPVGLTFMRSRLFIGLLVLSLLASSISAAPALTYPRVTPTTGAPGTTFTFTVHYAGEQPVLMELFLGDQAHTMLEVDSSDTNYTNGKDYYFESQLPEGTTIYYFKATIMPGQEVRTTAATVNVNSDDFGFDHLDVVLAVSFFIPIALIWLWLFRRFSKDMKQILDELKSK